MKCRQTYSSPNGFATVLTLLGMLLVVVSLPIATKLVTQNQDNRSNAAIESTYETCTNNTSKCTSGQMYFCNSGSWVTGIKCPSGECSGNVCKETAQLQSSVRYARGVCDGNTGRYACTTSESGTYSNYSDCASTCAPPPTPTSIPTQTSIPINPAGHEPECDKGETKCIDGYVNTCNTSFRWTKTSQTCSDSKVTPGIPLCTKITYGSWSDCVNGKQTRTVTKEPSNCSGGVTVEASEQTCNIPVSTPTPVICTSFTLDPWGDCIQYNNGYIQIRNVGRFPRGCSGGNPPPSKQPCCPSSNCSVCTNASLCSAAGCYWESQVKTCTSKPYTINCGDYKTYTSCLGGGCSWNGGSCSPLSSVIPSETIPTLEELYKEYRVDPSLGMEALQEAIRLRSYSEVQSASKDKWLQLIEVLTGVRTDRSNDDTLLDYCTTESCRIAKEYNLPDLTTQTDTYSFSSALIEKNKDVNYVVGEQAILNYNPQIANYYKVNQPGGFFINNPKYSNTVFIAEEEPLVVAHELVHLGQYKIDEGKNMTDGESEYEAYVYSTMVDLLDNTIRYGLDDELVRGIIGSTEKSVDELIVEQLVNQLMESSGY